jgi:hypothetical protein
LEHSHFDGTIMMVASRCLCCLSADEFTLLDTNGTNRARLGTPYAEAIVTGSGEARAIDGDETTLFSGTAGRCAYWMLDLTAAYALPITAIHSMVLHNRWAGFFGALWARQRDVPQDVVFAVACCTSARVVLCRQWRPAPSKQWEAVDLGAWTRHAQEAHWQLRTTWLGIGLAC